MSDRHYPAGVAVPKWARLCEHCKRPMDVYAGKFGSNKCRQAAYRKRHAEKFKASLARNVTAGRPAVAAANPLFSKDAPPSAENVIRDLTRRNPKKLHLNMRGGIK